MRSLAHVVGSLTDPRSWAHAIRLLHFYSYSHVRPMSHIAFGKGVAVAPNVSFRNGERISIGQGTHLGEHCRIWAGDSTGRITIGDHALFAPNVMITASNYEVPAGLPVMYQARAEEDVYICRNVWV